MSDDLLSQGLDSDITMVHERFIVVMQGRLRQMPLDQKERYFALLSALVGKLESSEKSLREVMQEMMSEAASIIMQELGGS